MADCSTKGGWHRCYIRTDETVPREPAGFKVPVLFFVCFANRNSCISQHTTFRPVFLHNLMTSECSTLHVFILSGSTVAVVALDRCTRHLAKWTWRSQRRQGIPWLDEPLSAPQACVLQPSLLLETGLFLDRAIAVFVCQPLGRTRYMFAHNRDTKCGFQFMC